MWKLLQCKCGTSSGVGVCTEISKCCALCCAVKRKSPPQRIPKINKLIIIKNNSGARSFSDRLGRSVSQSVRDPIDQRRRGRVGVLLIRKQRNSVRHRGHRECHLRFIGGRKVHIVCARAN